VDALTPAAPEISLINQDALQRIYRKRQTARFAIAAVRGFNVLFFSLDLHELSAVEVYIADAYFPGLLAYSALRKRRCLPAGPKRFRGDAVPRRILLLVDRDFGRAASGALKALDG